MLSSNTSDAHCLQDLQMPLHVQNLQGPLYPLQVVESMTDTSMTSHER